MPQICQQLTLHEREGRYYTYSKQKTILPVQDNAYQGFELLRMGNKVIGVVCSWTNTRWYNINLSVAASRRIRRATLLTMRATTDDRRSTPMLPGRSSSGFGGGSTEGVGSAKRENTCLAEIKKLERNRADRRRLLEKARCVLLLTRRHIVSMGLTKWLRVS